MVTTVLSQDEKRALIARACDRPVFRFCGMHDADHDAYEDRESMAHLVKQGLPYVPYFRCRKCDGTKWGSPIWSENYEASEYPNYFGDLNAMAEAESLLTPHQCHEYNKELVRALGADRPLTTSGTWTWGASAAVKAECLGRVLKLWD